MMKIYLLICLLMGMLTIVSCSSIKTGPISNNEYMVMSTLWMQKSAEYKALCLQAFYLAKIQLNLSLKKKGQRPLAVVADIDETVLSSAPLRALEIQSGRDYPSGLKEWLKNGGPKAIPGSNDFMKYAESKGVEIFYISNRPDSSHALTLNILKKTNFPVKRENIFLREKNNSKDKRRQKIMESHDIVLMLGSDLADFAVEFDGKSVLEKNEKVNKFHQEFGKKFILLPNPMYGEWVDAIYDYDSSLSRAAKNRKRKENLEAFKFEE